jgi:hypothetical protein
MPERPDSAGCCRKYDARLVVPHFCINETKSEQQLDSSWTAFVQTDLGGQPLVAAAAVLNALNDCMRWHQQVSAIFADV